LNIHEKIRKVAEMVSVIQKNKAAFQFKYVTEDELLAKVTAGMKKYGLNLIPTITPGTMQVIPYMYKKYNKTTKTIEDIYEILVFGEMVYRWINIENPDEVVEVPWAFCGQKDDLSQAFGGALTYTNRYFFMKALQLATIEDDPDNYRSKQKSAEEYEMLQMLTKARADIVDTMGKLIKAGVDKEEIYKIVAANNNGVKNPNTLLSVEICDKVLEEIKKLKTKKQKTESKE